MSSEEEKPPETAAEPESPESASRPPHSWVGLGIGFAIVLTALIVGLVMVVEFLNARTRNLGQATEGLANDLEGILEKNHIPKQSIKTYPVEPRQDAKAKWNFYLLDFSAPATLNLEGVEKLIRRDMEARHVTVNGSLVDKSSEGLSLQFENREFALVRATQAAAAMAQQVYTPPAVAPASVTPASPVGEPAAEAPAVTMTEMSPDELPLDSVNLEESDLGQPHLQNGVSAGDGSQPRAAIIVDDGGYGGAATDAILKLNPKLALAILPNTPHATETAERAAKAGFEIMLHMPMEALSAKDNFPGYISVSMKSEQMRGLLDVALTQIPGAVGVNNHTGSKFTASDTAMKAFLHGFKDRPLYFIDSHTASGSVAYSVAKELGVKSAANNLFLDNKPDPVAIRGQFAKFVAMCKSQGHGIAIGHFRPHTADVLAEEIPKLATEGITLVHVSELVK